MSGRRTSSRSYSDRTLKILWGRSAGRCAVPSCRIELFADATDYDPIVVIGDIAHIKAASDKGPRASKTQPKHERDEYDNLILLCKNCHARLDAQKNSNTVESIIQIRNAHENWVRSNLPERGRGTLGWKTIFLKGTHPIDAESALASLSPDFPIGKPLLIPATTGRRRRLPWNIMYNAMSKQINHLFSKSDLFNCRFAIFPIAPITACIAFGYLLTNRPRVRLFHYHRDEQSWIWPASHSNKGQIKVSGFPKEPVLTKGELAFCIHLSAYVSHDALSEVSQSFIGDIDLSVPKPSTGWLRTETQLKNLASVTRQAFESSLSLYPYATKWHLFFAGPAPAGVVVGQQLNPTMSCSVQLYEFSQTRVPHYQPSLLLSRRPQ